MVLEAWLQAHPVYSLQPGTWVKLAPQLYSVPYAGLLCLGTQSLQRLHRMLASYSHPVFAEPAPQT